MSDSNHLFLQQASDLMNDLNVRYMEAEFDDQVQLKDQLDRAMSDFSRAKLAILKNSIICTSDDVKQMQQLRQRLSNAPDVQKILATVVSFVSFVRLRFL
ncbi:hypothetical protein [Phormidesmis priestleyi]|uniref:hypothetical protein n=1 Tax=Phormidesmis priestleyi TaxID=268141 RepID=UPI00083A7A2E|nr:hypothetical protein [Phormidesmis priestleyi]